MPSLRPLHLLHTTCALLACVAGTAAAQRTAGTAAPASMNGDWVFVMDGDGQPQRVTLTADGDSVRGQVYGQAFAGTLRGTQFTFPVGSYRWRAAVRGDSMAGWLHTGTDSSQWRATRFRKPATPRRFEFSPSQYVREYSAVVPPVLRLYPGDTVHTTTVDAGGWGTGAFGERGNKRSQGGNPLTGPFYVEGAVPGDVLVVRLHRVRLNRGWAFSGTSIMDNALTPSYAGTRKEERLDNQWVLDTLAGEARLAQPSPALAGLRIPLAPFLGVVGVAPGGDGAPSSRQSGTFGGNMENAWLRDGTTLYLPVTTLGAYLYVGDGHAAQGDGELTGDAMETSMDVTFSVDVQRWRFASVPRAETDSALMSIGVAGSVDQAIRVATSDMASWLESEYKLTAGEAAIVMGFAAKYDVMDLVGSQFGVGVRVPKAVLRGVRRAP